MSSEIAPVWAQRQIWTNSCPMELNMLMTVFGPIEQFCYFNWTPQSWCVIVPPDLKFYIMFKIRRAMMSWKAQEFHFIFYIIIKSGPSIVELQLCPLNRPDPRFSTANAKLDKETLKIRSKLCRLIWFQSEKYLKISRPRVKVGCIAILEQIGQFGGRAGCNLCPGSKQDQEEHGQPVYLFRDRAANYQTWEWGGR